MAKLSTFLYYEDMVDVVFTCPVLVFTINPNIPLEDTFVGQQMASLIEDGVLETMFDYRNLPIVTSAIQCEVQECTTDYDFPFNRRVIFIIYLNNYDEYKDDIYRHPDYLKYLNIIAGLLTGTAPCKFSTRVKYAIDAIRREMDAGHTTGIALLDTIKDSETPETVAGIFYDVPNCIIHISDQYAIRDEQPREWEE